MNGQLARRPKWVATCVVVAVVVVMATLLASFSHLYPHLTHLAEDTRSDDGSAPRSSTQSSCPLPKRILVWTTLWREQSFAWEKIFYRQVSRQCPESRCELVYDHRLLDSADAIIFHGIDLHPKYLLPPTRRPDQIWIFLSLEAPPAVVKDQHVDLSKVGGVFNWTMTYRRDSDVVVPYGRIIRNPTQTHTNTSAKNYWATKTENKLAAWMVSHCGTVSRREWFVKDLVNHIRVDVFGRCGNKKCGKNVSIKTLGTFDQAECNTEIQEYMFYFAFENAICQDYVTEKFYLALSLDVVPVVFGGGDYAAIAPPNSYINALDFPSPKDLAYFLNMVAKNATFYNKFFEWKPHYKVELGHPFSPMVCDLCNKLHDPSSLTLHSVQRSPAEKAGVKVRGGGRDSSGSYPNMQSWFVEGSACRRWWKGSYDYRQHKLL